MSRKLHFPGHAGLSRSACKIRPGLIESWICWLNRKASLTGECAAYWRVMLYTVILYDGESILIRIKLCKGVAGDVDTYC